MPGRLLRMGLPILGLATAMLSRAGYIPFGLIPPSDESVGKYPSEGAVRDRVPCLAAFILISGLCQRHPGVSVSRPFPLSCACSFSVLFRVVLLISGLSHEALAVVSGYRIVLASVLDHGAYSWSSWLYPGFSPPPWFEFSSSQLLWQYFTP